MTGAGAASAAERECCSSAWGGFSPACDESSALGFANFGIAMNLLKLRGIDDRANIDVFIQAVAQLQLFDASYQHVRQFFADGTMHNDATACCTTLSRGAIGAP